MKQMHWYSGFLLLLTLTGCEQIQRFFASPETPEIERTLLAKVHENKLYTDDLEGMLEQAATPEDSLNRIHRYVDNWVRKQLILHEAEKNSRLNEAELQQRLLDYKYQLLVHDYQRAYIEKNLDKEVDSGAILAYYNSNKSNFELKKNIVRAYFVKLKDNDPKIEKARQWIQTSDGEELQKLREHCYQFAQSYSLEDSLWIPFDNLVLGSPISPDTYFEHNRFMEARDSSHVYFLRILDYRTTDETSPLEFVRDQVKTLLINRRKLQLQEELEEKILQKARREQHFETYLPELTEN